MSYRESMAQNFSTNFTCFSVGQKEKQTKQNKNNNKIKKLKNKT